MASEEASREATGSFKRGSERAGPEIVSNQKQVSIKMVQIWRAGFFLDSGVCGGWRLRRPPGRLPEASKAPQGAQDRKMLQIKSNFQIKWSRS